MLTVTCRAVFACFAAATVLQLQMVGGLQHRRMKATFCVAVLVFLASTGSAQTILSSGQLATCVNDGTVSARSVQQ